MVETLFFKFVSGWVFILTATVWNEVNENAAVSQNIGDVMQFIIWELTKRHSLLQY